MKTAKQRRTTYLGILISGTGTEKRRFHLRNIRARGVFAPEPHWRKQERPHKRLQHPCRYRTRHARYQRREARRDIGPF